MKSTKIQYVLKYIFNPARSGLTNPQFLETYDDLEIALAAYHKRRSLYSYNKYYLSKTVTEVYETTTLLDIPDAPELKHTITFRTCPNPAIIVGNAATQEALDWIAQNTHFFNEELYYEKESRETLREDFNLHINPNYDFEEVLAHLATFPRSQVIRHVPEVQVSRPQYHWSSGHYA